MVRLLAALGMLVSGCEAITVVMPPDRDAGIVSADADLPPARNSGADGSVSDASFCPNGAVVGDYVIRTSMDALRLASCTKIDGNLAISEGSTTQLALPNLQRIEGKLTIRANRTLSKLSLPALTSVGDDLVTEANSALSALELPALERVGRGIYVSQNAELRQAELRALVGVGASLSIGDNPKLLALDVSRLIDVAGDVRAFKNPVLERLGLDGLRAISQDLHIEGCALAAVDLPRLTTVKGSLLLIGDARLDELTSPALETIGGSLALTDVPLETLRLPALRMVGGDFTPGGHVKALEAMSLESVAGTLTFPNALTSVRLHALTFVGAELRVQNTNLSVLNLPALRETATGLTISNNPQLASLTLSALERVGVEYSSDLVIEDNPSLDQLGLAVTLTVSGTVRVARNANLADLTLPTLDSAAYVKIEDNAALVRVSAPRLTHSSGIRIVSNAALVTLVMDGLVSVNGELVVGSNPELKAMSFPKLAEVSNAFLDGWALETVSLPALSGVTGSLRVFNTIELAELAMPVLEAASLQVDFNSGLTRIDLPALTHLSSLFVRHNHILEALKAPQLSTVSRFKVTDNFKMPTHAIETLLDQLTVAPEEVVVSGNQ